MWRGNCIDQWASLQTHTGVCELQMLSSLVTQAPSAPANSMRQELELKNTRIELEN